MQKNWKNMEHECVSDTNCYSAPSTVTKKIGTGTGGLGNKRKNGDHPNYIIRIGQNTWRLEETCFHTNPNEKPLDNAGMKDWVW